MRVRSPYLRRFARTCYRRRRLVVATWLLGFVALLSLSRVAGGGFENSFELPGSESRKAGPASAVLVDATIVRLVLVPAAMELLGDRNWWLPSRLDRLLPRVRVGGQPQPAPSDVVDPVRARTAH